MTVPNQKVVPPKTDVEDPIGSQTEANFKERGYAGKGLDTVRVTRSVAASKGTIPTPKVADSDEPQGTKFGPNTRGFARTGDHNDDWHVEEFGG